jgi:hypothetical protein
MRRFYSERQQDVSGVSGTGRVAQGVLFDNGKVALSWLTEYSSTTIFDNWDDMVRIHGHSGSTLFIFLDEGDE